jgi:hypothetical protein
MPQESQWVSLRLVVAAVFVVARETTIKVANTL